MLLYIYLFFHVLSQQSYALNSLIPNVFANSKAFFKCDPVNWNFLATFLNKRKENYFIYLVVAPTVCAYS